MLWICCCYYS